MIGNTVPRSASYAIVIAAWKKALKSERCDPTLTWGETGADSIASLHLVLELERSAGGRSVTFDSVRPHMTVDDLAALLDEAAPLPAPMAPTANPILHLFPGLYGDDPRLANFRQALQPTISVHLHESPDLRHSAATLRCLKLTGEAAAKNIERWHPDGPIFLSGFSFGGGVAFEVARVLSQAGRHVAFLGLLDTILGEALAMSSATPTINSKHLKRRLQLALVSSDSPRALLLYAFDRTSPIFAHRVRRYMFGLFREYALRHWNPEPLAVNTLLAASEEYGPRTEPIWRRLCPRLQVVRLPNGHVEMFEHPAIGLLAPRFEDAVRRAAGVALREAES